MRLSFRACRKADLTAINNSREYKRSSFYTRSVRAINTDEIREEREKKNPCPHENVRGKTRRLSSVAISREIPFCASEL